MILISNDFWHNIKIYSFDPYNVLLVIATNIAVLLMTASVLQGHICLLFVSMVQIYLYFWYLLVADVIYTLTNKVFEIDIVIFQ